MNPMNMPAQPGGFWKRAVALTIDGIILAIIMWPVQIIVGIGASMILRADSAAGGFLTGIASWPLTFLIQFVYAAWFYKNKGGTPGKLLINLRVVNAETGTNLDAITTAKREILGKFVCLLTFGIGYLIVAFRDDKKGLHDLIAGTQVLKK